MRYVVTALLGLAALAPGAVLAGDREARRFYNKAVEKWNDPDPAIPVKYAEKALDHAENKILRTNVLFLLGRLHHSRTGDFDQAEKYYDTVVKENIGVTDNTLKRVKSDAFRNLGNLIYARTGDVSKSLVKYQASHRTYATSETADVLSQFLFRLGRDQSKTKASRDKQLTMSIKLAREAIERDAEGSGEKDLSEGARYRLQLVIALTAAGKADEAAKEWEAVRQDKLADNSLYQQAVLMALREEDPAKIAAKLHESLDPRPTPKTRNDLRHFIRTEPDFRAFQKREDWSALVTDEPLEGQGGSGEKPASRPSR